MESKPKTASKSLTIRIKPDLYAALVAEAEETHRTVSNTLNHIIHVHLSGRLGKEG
jgi:hypothetical protein